MNFDLVYILPLVSLALIALLSPFKRNPSLTTSFRSRRRRKIILGRLTVLVLLIAPIVALLSPVPDIANLFKGLLFFAAVLIPAILVHIYMTIRYGSLQKVGSSSGASDTIEAKKNRPGASRTIDTKTPASVDSSFGHTRIDADVTTPQNLPVIDLSPFASSANKVSKNQQAEASLLVKSKAPIVGDVKDSSATRKTAEVQEQLNRASDLVDSHDLGNSDYSLSNSDLQKRRFSLNTDVPLTIDSALATVDRSASELSKMSSGEISELVTNLRTDRTRLQKLVIAQQASIESERHAHDKSRTVARDAIKIMRDARHGQKLAEKLARRERTERKRVEHEYKKVTSALNNAMSIIEARKAESADV